MYKERDIMKTWSLRHKLLYRYNEYKVKIYLPWTCEIDKTPNPFQNFDLFFDPESECLNRSFKQFKISF